MNEAKSSHNTLQALVKSHNSFGVRLYKKLTGPNKTFSPIGLTAALLLASSGAKAKTQTQLLKLLGHRRLNKLSKQRRTKALAALHRDFAKLQQQLATNRRNDVQFEMGHSLWFDQSLQLLSPFLSLYQGLYKGNLRHVDFSRPSANAAKHINDWINKQTKGLIPGLYTPQSFDKTTRMVLVNAVYFQGTWESPFKKSATYKSDFFVDRHHKVEIDFMYKKRYFPTYRDRQVTVLRLDYEGGFAFFAVVPRRRWGLAAIERRLSARQLRRWFRKTSKQNKEFELSIPTWTIRVKSPLNGPLQSMGLRSAFGKSADFSGFHGKKNVSLGDIRQETYLKVDEVGTQAAAATGMTLKTKNGHFTPALELDHPFLFAIQHLKTGSLLFLGRLGRPKGKKITIKRRLRVKTKRK